MFETYKNKKIFITGHTGFKGSWLSLWLTKLGGEVLGYSLEPETEPSIFKTLNLENKLSKSVIGNILDKDNLEKVISDFKPDVVFHLAAQPLVRLSYREPLLTYQTNVIGSLNVLEAAGKFNCPVVNITTDKCYENKEEQVKYKETDKLGGFDMYSSSKACVEIMTSSYRQSFGLPVVTARAGNVIGGGDWAKDRIVPDCIKCIQNNKPIQLRYPNALRPFQFVLEPLLGYLILGEKLLRKEKFIDYAFNFGPYESTSVLKLTKGIVNVLNKGEITFCKENNLHEANLLMLDIEKAIRVLNWEPKYSFNKAIEETVCWYKHFYDKDINMLDFSLDQIDRYEEKWKES